MLGNARNPRGMDPEAQRRLGELEETWMANQNEGNGVSGSRLDLEHGLTAAPVGRNGQDQHTLIMFGPDGLPLPPPAGNTMLAGGHMTG